MTTRKKMLAAGLDKKQPAIPDAESVKDNSRG
jgi:hypothetical protein